MWDPFPTLETPRLVLRRIGRDDAAALFAIMRDEETMRYWSCRPYIALAQAHAKIDQLDADLAEGNAIYWAIARRGEPDLLGICGFNAWRKHRRGDISYIVGRPHWGTGIMREALPAMLSYGFTALDLHSVEAGVTPGNDGSVALLERLGFCLEGHTRESFWAEDHFVDSMLFSLLQRDWAKDRAAPRHPSGDPV
jgi:ribosomal-protein-alanine N-acetyltransferase